MDKPLLILDLDETLIFSAELEPPFGCDFRVFHYFVRKRPHVDVFVRTVRQWYDLAVWSSSGDDYARQIVERVFGAEPGLEFVWTQAQCTRYVDFDRQREYLRKNLKKVKQRGFDLARVLIIDDKPEVVRRSYGNHLCLKPFEGHADDCELIEVIPFLKWLSGVQNFRAIDKRNWRKIYSEQ